LPVGVREPGEWVTLTADLSKPTAAGLEVATIAAADPPSDLPEVCWRPALARDQADKPSYGPGCGDIVLERVRSLEERRFFVRERPPELDAGGRVYLTWEREVVGFLVLTSWRISPNGVRLACAPRMDRLEPSIAIDGQLQTERWRWRWWQIEHERRDTRDATAASS